MHFFPQTPHKLYHIATGLRLLISEILCLEFISIIKNISFISHCNVFTIFIRMGPNFLLQITVWFHIIISQQPAELFQISQGKSSTEIRTRKVLLLSTIPRPNNINRKKTSFFIFRAAKTWKMLTNRPLNII